MGKYFYFLSGLLLIPAIMALVRGHIRVGGKLMYRSSAPLEYWLGILTYFMLVAVCAFFASRMEL